MVLNKGNTAEIVEYGNEKVCKLFYAGYPKTSVLQEYHNAQVLERMKLPVPKVHEMIDQNDRVGIVYERIYGTSLLEVMREETNVEDSFCSFVNLQRELLGCHTTSVQSYKDFLLNMVKEAEPNLKTQLKDRIVALPEGDSLCHGDFHPGNVIRKQDGSLAVVDFMNVCHGDWKYDVARTFFLLSEYDSTDTIANLYLKVMDVSYEAIAEFVSVIAECRKLER